MPEACKISAPGRRPRLEIDVTVAQRHGLHGSQKCRRARDRSGHRRPPRPARHPHSRCRLRRRCDATYSNYQEANRAFYRQTVIPLALRTARALSDWFCHPVRTAARSGEVQTRDLAQLRFELDLDQVDALAPEREALWARLEKTSFLTPDEKRALIGYGAAPVPGSDPAGLTASKKFNPNHDDRGRFDFSPDGNQRVAAGPRGGGPPKAPPTPAKPAPQPPPPPKKLEDVLKPGGKELGTQNPGASSEIRTATSAEFEQIQKQLLDGAKEVAAPSGYTGKWYQRSDGTVIGVRDSTGSGPTLEVVQGKTSGLPNGYKVHRK
jgi:Phage portal protein